MMFSKLINPNHPLIQITLRWIKWLTHPIVVFVSLQIVWISFVILWVVWFINQKETIVRLSQVLGSTKFSGPTGVTTLVVGSVLLGIILFGTIVLFVFTQVQSSLLRQQRSFVSSVTHELRSPLASLQLSFETMQRPELPENIRTKLFGMVQSDLARLTQLVDRILISSRLDRGIIDFKSQIESFNLRETIFELAEQSTHHDSELLDRLQVHCSREIWVESIRLAFNLVLGNLIENAIKYSPKSSPIEVKVTCTRDELRIVVRDQGFGLSKSDQRKIFKMFHRTSRATKNAVPGTGIGLYIVQSMVRGLGGHIWVESEGHGKGAAFFVSFPGRIARLQPAKPELMDSDPVG